MGNNIDILSDGTLNVNLELYEGNATINGNLVTSNLTVLGSSTMLDTNVYITERLEIINDGLNNAVDIKQKISGYDIINASNLTNEVFNHPNSIISVLALLTKFYHVFWWRCSWNWWLGINFYWASF